MEGTPPGEVLEYRVPGTMEAIGGKGLSDLRERAIDFYKRRSECHSSNSVRRSSLASPSYLPFPSFATISHTVLCPSQHSSYKKREIRCVGEKRCETCLCIDVSRERGSRSPSRENRYEAKTTSTHPTPPHSLDVPCSSTTHSCTWRTFWWPPPRTLRKWVPPRLAPPPPPSPQRHSQVS